MTTDPKPPNIPPQKTVDDMKKVFLEHASALWDEWVPSFLEQMEQTVKARATMNVPVTFDLRETTPMLIVGTRFSRTYGEKVEERFDDPKQLGLEPVLKELVRKSRKESVEE